MREYFTARDSFVCSRVSNLRVQKITLFAARRNNAQRAAFKQIVSFLYRSVTFALPRFGIIYRSKA